MVRLQTGSRSNLQLILCISWKSSKMSAAHWVGQQSSEVLDACSNLSFHPTFKTLKTRFWESLFCSNWKKQLHRIFPYLYNVNIQFKQYSILFVPIYRYSFLSFTVFRPDGFIHNSLNRQYLPVKRQPKRKYPALSSLHSKRNGSKSFNIAKSSNFHLKLRTQVLQGTVSVSTNTFSTNNCLPVQDLSTGGACAPHCDFYRQWDAEKLVKKTNHFNENPWLTKSSDADLFWKKSSR